MGSIGEINRLKYILEGEDLVRSRDKILDSNGEEYTLSKTSGGVHLKKNSDIIKFYSLSIFTPHTLHI